MNVLKTKRAKTVSVLNQKLTVLTESSDPHVEEVAALVERRVEEVMCQTKGSSTLTATLMACLNIADELVRLKQSRDQTAKNIGTRVDRLLEMLDAKQDLEGDRQQAL